MTPESVMHDFQTPTPIRLTVQIPRGRVRLIAEDRETTGVELVADPGDAAAQQWLADAQVTQNGEEILVLIRDRHWNHFGIGGRGIDATVRLPNASAAKLSIGAGRIETDGPLGDVEAATGSGAIRLAQTARASAHSGSGDISIANASGSVDVKSGSGNVAIGAVGGDAKVVTASGNAGIAQFAGAARVNTASGRLEVGEAGDSLDAFSASGAIAIRSADHGRISAKTVSGRISVGVAQGAAAWLDINTMTGRVRSALEESAPPAIGEKRVELMLNTVSGDVDVSRC